MTLRTLGRQPHCLSHPQGEAGLKEDRAVTYVEMFLRGEGGNKGLRYICDLATEVMVTLTKNSRGLGSQKLGCRAVSKNWGSGDCEH